MKQRLLVMNGQRLVQSEQGGHWVTDKIEKAGAIKPGIYNIYLALGADKSKTYEGTVLHIDHGVLYQQVGKSFIIHALTDFDHAPEIGSISGIKYSAGAATVSPVETSRRLRRGIT